MKKDYIEKLRKVVKYLIGSFQFISLGMLMFCVIVLINQQSEIKTLKSDLQSVDYNCDNYQIEKKLDALERGLDDLRSNLSSEIDYLQSNLSSEIDDVRRTVIIWSN